MISQNIVFNQASFALEYLTCQVIISQRKWSGSLHIILIFLRQVLQSGVFHQNRHSHPQVPLNVNYCQNNLKSVRKKAKMSAIPKYLGQCSLNFLEIWSLFWIFLPAVFYKQIYLEGRRGGLAQGVVSYSIFFQDGSN